MRKALIVGIDYYENGNSLNGSANDAKKVMHILSNHADDSRNFHTMDFFVTEKSNAIDCGNLKEMIVDLFNGQNEIALFYFSGHGSFNKTEGGQILTSETKRGDDGVLLSFIMKAANDSPARNKILILDSCFSGSLGDSTNFSGLCELKEGVTILTACTAQEAAYEDDGVGLFTDLLVDALNGGAASILGDITPGSIYAHIDQSLGPWNQRPVFKTNVQNFVSLRKATPAIRLSDLKKLNELFPSRGYKYQLDPSFEPNENGKPEGAAKANPENNAVFAILQKYNRLNLLVPDDATHMWDAAMESKTCSLTPLGEHYRKIVIKKLL